MQHILEFFFQSASDDKLQNNLFPFWKLCVLSLKGGLKAFLPQENVL